MTILTKPSFGAKQHPETDATVVVVENGSIADQDENGNNDKLLLLHTRARRMFSVSSMLLFLATLCLICMAVLTGMIIYRRYQTQPARFHAICGIPYDSEYEEARNALNLMNQKLYELSNGWDNAMNADKLQSLFDGNDSNDQDFFKEEFDLNFDDDTSDIRVPDFRDGRMGRFLHDFKSNQTAIIDETSKRCFVMPLDRDAVLPPQSLFDLINKMHSGYYDINTTAIRKDMRVITPAVDNDDMSSISPKVQYACTNMKIYRMEKIVNGVFKRSVDSPPHIYGEWAGALIQYHVDNMHDLEN